MRRVLEDQPAVAERLKKTGVITPSVFFYTVGKNTGQQITESGFNKAWRKARVAVRNLVRAGVPERVAMQLAGIRLGPCSRGTTLSAVATCEM